MSATITSDQYKVIQHVDSRGPNWWGVRLCIDAKPKDLDKISEVVYILHPTFEDPVRTSTDRASGFSTDIEGWGTFTIQVQLHFADGTETSLLHTIVLEHADKPFPKAAVPAIIPAKNIYSPYAEIKRLRSRAKLKNIQLAVTLPLLLLIGGTFVLNQQSNNIGPTNGDYAAIIKSLREDTTLKGATLVAFNQKIDELDRSYAAVMVTRDEFARQIESLTTEKNKIEQAASADRANFTESISLLKTDTLQKSRTIQENARSLMALNDRLQTTSRELASQKRSAENVKALIPKSTQPIKNYQQFIGNQIDSLKLMSESLTNILNRNEIITRPNDGAARSLRTIISAMQSSILRIHRQKGNMEITFNQWSDSLSKARAEVNRVPN